MKGARVQGHLEELVVTIVFSIFETTWYVCTIKGVVSYMVMFKLEFSIIHSI